MERPVNEIALSMNLAFNEISFRPYCDSNYELKTIFKAMLQKYNGLKTEYNIPHIIFPSDISTRFVLPQLTFQEWFSTLPSFEKSLFLGVIRRPFSNDVLEGQEEQLNRFSFGNAELGIEEDYCTGLGVAYLQNSATISLHTHSYWCSDTIAFNSIEPDEIVNVPNIADCPGEPGSAFQKVIETCRNIELEETDILPENKPIHFRDDHGTDVLMLFAKRLRNSKYVTKIINSMQFNRHTVRFIRNVFDDGTIEIVLHWDDRGLGLVIQTTGKNYHETKAIAEILRNKYDK